MECTSVLKAHSIIVRTLSISLDTVLLMPLFLIVFIRIMGECIHGYNKSIIYMPSKLK